MYKNIAQLNEHVGSLLLIEGGKLRVPAGRRVPGELTDRLVRNHVFNADPEVKSHCRRLIREICAAKGIFPASIQKLYEAAGRGALKGRTVPAINLRGLTYDSARATFRAAIAGKVGAFILEIARSEQGYTGQTPEEYATCVLAAALREVFRGPVFIQGDHYQFNAAKFAADPESEVRSIRQLIADSIKAEFYNIDIDASTLVDISKPALAEQQSANYRLTAEMTRFVREVQPPGVVVSVGAEIGEVGKENSTVEDLEAFMTGYLRELGGGLTGVSKISVQTGTRHGGVVLPDGSIARVQVDFGTLRNLSDFARERYGLAGAVQHGASTLPDEAFDAFPKTGAAEVHLATGFQNLIYESGYFPKELLDRIVRHMKENFAGFRKAGDTDEQFFYENRKRAFGPFKREMWDLPQENLAGIRRILEERFNLLFTKLNVLDTVDLVNTYVARPRA